jgi:hypothetical protein
MARWIELPVAPNALERTAARAWPSGTRVKRLCALHTSARWKTIPQRAGKQYLSALENNTSARWIELPIAPNALEQPLTLGEKNRTLPSH